MSLLRTLCHDKRRKRVSQFDVYTHKYSVPVLFVSVFLPIFRGAAVSICSLSAETLSCFSSTFLLTVKVLTVFGKIPTPNMFVEIFWVWNHVKLELFKSTFYMFSVVFIGGVKFCLQLYNKIPFQCDIWMFPCFTFRRIMTHSHVISGFDTSFTIMHGCVVEVAGGGGSVLCQYGICLQKIFVVFFLGNELYSEEENTSWCAGSISALYFQKINK